MVSSPTNFPSSRQWDWSLGGRSLWQFLKQVLHNIVENDILAWASGLAFNFVLALFPLLFFLLTLFALFASRSSELRMSLLHYLSDFVPPAASDLLVGVTDELALNATSGRLTFAVLLSLWFASGGVSSMISTLNASFRLAETRSWIRIRVTSIGLTLAISVLLLSALFMVLAGGRLAGWIGRVLHLKSTIVVLWTCLQWPCVVVFIVLSFSLIYNYGPSLVKDRWLWITPGSVVGTALWLGASFAFRVYLHFFDTYEATYGSLGAAMILLVWLYVTGLAFLVGAEIDAEIARGVRDSASQ